MIYKNGRTEKSGAAAAATASSSTAATPLLPLGHLVRPLFDPHQYQEEEEHQHHSKRMFYLGSEEPRLEYRLTLMILLTVILILL